MMVFGIFFLIGISVTFNDFVLFLIDLSLGAFLYIGGFWALIRRLKTENLVNQYIEDLKPQLDIIALAPKKQISFNFLLSTIDSVISKLHSKNPWTYFEERHLVEGRWKMIKSIYIPLKEK